MNGNALFSGPIQSSMSLALLVANLKVASSNSLAGFEAAAEGLGVEAGSGFYLHVSSRLPED